MNRKNSRLQGDIRYIEKMRVMAKKRRWKEQRSDRKRLVLPFKKTVAAIASINKSK